MKFSSGVTKLWLIVWILNQFKGYNSRTTEASMTKLDMHLIVIVILIQHKFHEIPFNSYLVMAPDG